MLATLGCSAELSTAEPGVEKALNDRGKLLVRFEMGNKGRETDLSVNLKAEQAKIVRLEDYFFEEGEDQLFTDENAWKCRTTIRYLNSSPAKEQDVDVVVAWLEGAGRNSRITTEINGENFPFLLGELAEKEELVKEIDGAYLSADILYHDEIGTIDTRKVAIEKTGENFDFVIFCDTHTGAGHPLFNSFIERNIEAANKLDPKPAFLIINGDSTTGQGQKEHFETLEGLLRKCDVPVLLEMGNHESRYDSTFGPGYNLSAFDNYFQAQRQINGMTELVYSFDLGKWHFIVWPDPLRRGFWQRHPHYFDWLEKDLEKNKGRPTIFFQHIHSLPMGINPMTNYVNSTQTRRMLLDILTKHGNVKYVFSGHTHITLKASIKTARRYKGTTFINLPPTFSPGRNFGEPDLGGDGPAGFTIVAVRGEKATVNYRMLNGDIYGYPESFVEFDPGRYRLWLKEVWELPAGENIANGGFEDDLAGWSRPFVYTEDQNPSNICRQTTKVSHSGERSLHLFSRRRGYYVPGDNRMPQTVNYICQPIRLKASTTPVLHGWYRLDSSTYTPDDLSGACIRIDGYKGSSRRMRLCYWIGTGYFKPNGLWSPWEDYYHFDITGSGDKWHRVIANARKDYETASARSFDELDLDRLVITLQVWNLNQHLEGEGADKPMQIGIYFDDIDVTFEPAQADVASTLDANPIKQKDKSQIESRWLLSGMASEE